MSASANFAAFFQRVLVLSLDEPALPGEKEEKAQLAAIEHAAVIAFLVNCFNSVVSARERGELGEYCEDSRRWTSCGRRPVVSSHCRFGSISFQ